MTVYNSSVSVLIHTFAVPVSVVLCFTETLETLPATLQQQQKEKKKKNTNKQRCAVNKISIIASGDADIRYWIGASDIQVEGEWRWAVLGELFTYSNWAIGIPNNLGGNENCAEIMRTGRWNDNQCMNQAHYICEERYN